jgi:hypothetical protein
MKVIADENTVSMGCDLSGGECSDCVPSPASVKDKE